MIKKQTRKRAALRKKTKKNRRFYRKYSGGRAVPPSNRNANNHQHVQYVNEINNNAFNTEYYNLEQVWLNLYAELDHHEIIDVRGFMIPRFYHWQTMGGELDLSFQPADLPDVYEEHYDLVRTFFEFLSQQNDDIIQEFINTEFSGI